MFCYDGNNINGQHYTLIGRFETLILSPCPFLFFLKLVTGMSISLLDITKSSYCSFHSDRTMKVWSIDGVSGDLDQPIKLRSKATVAAHDKDINSLAVSPNDSLVCSGSEVSKCDFWVLSIACPTISYLNTCCNICIFFCLGSHCIHMEASWFSMHSCS